MSDEQSFIKDNALAGGAISVSLLETLLEMGVLKVGDCRAVLERARAAVLSANAPESMSASRYISQIIVSKFPMDVRGANERSENTVLRHDFDV